MSLEQFVEGCLVACASALEQVNRRIFFLVGHSVYDAGNLNAISSPLYPAPLTARTMY